MLYVSPWSWRNVAVSHCVLNSIWLPICKLYPDACLTDMSICKVCFSKPKWTFSHNAPQASSTSPTLSIVSTIWSYRPTAGALTLTGFLPQRRWSSSTPRFRTETHVQQIHRWIYGRLVRSECRIYILYTLSVHLLWFSRELHYHFAFLSDDGIYLDDLSMSVIRVILYILYVPKHMLGFTAKVNKLILEFFVCLFYNLPFFTLIGAV